ncbi:MAG: pyrroline-5-carboxylate reductase [Deltaproteobacteria bacterium]|nr:pyrroline-5-carboxylate reductase [Deltaproteobacteria bacterium]
MSALAGRRLGFIGGGNMAEAIVRGLLEQGVVERGAVAVAEPNAERRELLAAAHGIACRASNRDVAREADLLVIAVKPQAMAVALAELGEFAGLAVTVAAGIAARVVEAAMPARVVRAMPNTPALVRAGVTALAAGARATDADLVVATELFAAVGRVVRVPEAQLDAVTGLSGSGPAYVFVMIEALADGGVKMGLPRDVAMTLAAETVLGSARLLVATGEHPAALKDRVTSPGGTTIAGLARLEAAGVRSAFIEAVEAATRRANELGR